MYCKFCNTFRKFKKAKISYTFIKSSSLSMFYSKYGLNIKKYLKKNNQLKN